MDVKIKRIYEDAVTSDGIRILVDRIWPRGISKEFANLDDWRKDLAPSTELRKWFDHEESRFAEFSKRYKKELGKHIELIDELVKKTKGKRLTLVYSAKDEAHNQAVVLKEFLDEY